MSDSHTKETRSFHDWRCIETDARVVAAIYLRHKDQMKVFSSFSDPDGTFQGGPGRRGVMETTWGLRDADYPLYGHRSTYDISEHGQMKFNPKDEYFLIVADKRSDE